VNISICYDDFLRWAKQRRFDILSKISYVKQENADESGFYFTDTVLAAKRVCPFLVIKNDTAVCSIQETKPQTCTDAPFVYDDRKKKLPGCPALEFDVDERDRRELKITQLLQLQLAKDRKEKLIEILETVKRIGEGFNVIKEFGDDPTEQLGVTSLGTERTGWSETGTTPFLDSQDYPDNYISTSSKQVEHGDFSFANTVIGAGTINSVHLYIYAYYSVARRLGCWIWDDSASDWVDLGVTVSTQQWYNIDISSYITTWAEIDAFKLFVKSFNSTANAIVDAAYILVDYTATGVDVEPGPAVAQATAVTPSVTLGNLNVSVGVSIAQATATTPSVTIEGVDVSVGVAAVNATATGISVTIGNLDVSVGVAAVNVTATTPSVTLGNLNVSIGVAAVNATAATIDVDQTFDVNVGVAVVR
jgi:Fe-S-cluster containining protein